MLKSVIAVSIVALRTSVIVLYHVNVLLRLFHQSFLFLDEGRRTKSQKKIYQAWYVLHYL